mgnify:CR=1 FL=1
MKKLIAIVMFLGIIAAVHTSAFAQDEPDTAMAANDTTAMVEDTTATAEVPEVATEEEEVAEEEEAKGVHNVLKTKFIEGDPIWMTPVLVALVIGLALSIERIITLSLSTTNTKKLLTRVNDALSNGNVEEAKDICRATRGPVASIFYQGLDRLDEGVEQVEKSLVSYGSVQMAMLERGLVWISLFIALAPMLGFMGTVIGMIQAFADIEAAGDINPTIVAGGIKVALLTTAFGLIAAIILQIFYNYIISKVDSIVNAMEDASITFVDIVIRTKVANQDK